MFAVANGANDLKIYDAATLVIVAQARIGVVDAWCPDMAWSSDGQTLAFLHGTSADVDEWNATIVRLGSLLAVLAVGCSKRGDSDLVRVSGKVTYNAQPVEGAAVTFASMAAGTPAAGMTAPDGTYTLAVKPS
ncbi:MAG: hypothetical protein B7Z73_03725, partial [Planctomycetia bacterium 21-64-5]